MVSMAWVMLSSAAPGWSRMLSMMAASSVSAATWVELAPLSDPALLTSAVAHQLGIPIPGGNPQAALVGALASRFMLLALDNAEHLLEAVANLVAALLDGAPGVRVLVTSQAALNLDGERVFRLGALAAPDLGATVEDALAASGIFARHPELDGTTCGLGIWGRAVTVSQTLRDRDRIEIYRPLLADPKQVRRTRAERERKRGSK